MTIHAGELAGDLQPSAMGELNILSFDQPDLACAAFRSDPWPTYARLRVEAPACRVVAPMLGDVWLVTRYDDVSALLKDPRLAKDPANAPDPGGLNRRRSPPRMFAPLTRNMLGADGPDHGRLKRLVQAAFTPRRIAALADRTEATALALIDAVAGKQRFDLIADFAMPLPVAVICDLLGVPLRDRDRFARWSRALIRAGSTRLSVIFALPDALAFLRYLRRLILLKRREPEDDLVSALAQDEAADRLDADELMAMVAILLSAGHETTTHLIGNGMLALMEHPAERERLRATPGLIETAVEELLRFCGPVGTSTQRYCRETIEIAGTPIPPGSLVLGVIASANRDAAHFGDPDRLDLGRQPNRHLTFGEGGHYCVGAPLARLEGRIAFGALLHRLPRLRPTQPRDHLRWRPGLILRGLKELPVEHAGPRA